MKSTDGDFSSRRGRYRRTTQEEELARLYHIPIPKLTDLPISYNIAASQKVFTIRFNPETRQRRRRSLDALQWGLIPYWAKDSKIAYRTINARAETVDKAPSSRHAFIKRRCLIPADSFYEWRETAKPKLPFAIATKRVSPRLAAHDNATLNTSVATARRRNTTAKPNE